MAAEVKETELTAADGRKLFFRRWTPVGTNPVVELLVVHGYAEHGGRYRELAFALAEQGIATSAIDVRGHGKSAGNRGHVSHFTDYFLDVDAAFNEMPKGPPRFLLGHSHGGLISLDYVAHRKPALKGLLLSNPFLDLAMPVPAVKVIAGKIMARLIPPLALPSGIPPEGVSRDPAIVDAYKRDPLVFKTATAGWFVECQNAQERVRGQTEIDLPVLYMHSDKDPIASPTANARLAEALHSPDKTVWLREGGLHEILNEIDRGPLHKDIGKWILAHKA